MERIRPGASLPLYGIEATRVIERAEATKLPSFTLMSRAGWALARWCVALYPHARVVWIACGPGNNGGDGLVAAAHLRSWGKSVHVSLVPTAPDRASADATRAIELARAAGLPLHADPPEAWDCCIDAMLGIGARMPLPSPMDRWAASMHHAGRPILAADLPSGLNGDTGAVGGVRAHHTLALLTLKPGMWMGVGRDHCGDIWYCDLDTSPATHAVAETGSLIPAPSARSRAHASHKGSWGDVAVLGGASGMEGAAVLAGVAALHAGAGRVLISTEAIDASDGRPAIAIPELMHRRMEALDLAACAVACGCGGGQWVRQMLPRAIAEARQLVLDADALNGLAESPALYAQLRARALTGRPSVLTPHPLEAARLLNSSVAAVQADRVAAAEQLSIASGCVVVLKGSGSVVKAPGRVPRINPTGNARLATAGTGDVLAGLLAALLARGLPAADAAEEAVFRHGQVADRWTKPSSLTALMVARALSSD